VAEFKAALAEQFVEFDTKSRIAIGNKQLQEGPQSIKDIGVSNGSVVERFGSLLGGGREQAYRPADFDKVREKADSEVRKHIAPFVLGHRALQKVRAMSSNRLMGSQRSRSKIPPIGHKY
jgi:hypothetical protein